MRYWIYWNDLVQGPFELDELVSLRAFSEELPVCLENRQEWMPANRVAELSPLIELVKSRRLPPPLPPPPPDRPPSTAPLQGEFFTHSPGQQRLFADGNDDPNGLFSYRYAGEGEARPAGPAGGAVTMPFHFAGRTVQTGDLPAARPPETPVVAAPMEILEVLRAPLAAPSPVQESPVREEAPAEERPEGPAEIPLQVYPAPGEPFSGTRPTASRPWILWAGGALVILSLIGSATYWLMDRASSRSAIAEANRHSAVKPLPPVPARGREGPAPAIPKKRLPAATQPVVPKPSVVLAPPALPRGRGKPAPAAAASGADPWIGRQAEAIDLVVNHPLFDGKSTVGGHAKAILEAMHDKELLHAADTGERLYMPDKLSLSSLREEGSVYRVYLNFSALRAAGERVQSHSYQFRADLQSRDVMSDDGAARRDFLEASAPAKHAHPPMVDDIESILSAVDLLNKQKLRSMILGKSRRNKKERENIQAALEAAQAKANRSIIYFRTKYPEQMLQNVGKAYLFSAFLNSHG